MPFRARGSCSISMYAYFCVLWWPSAAGLEAEPKGKPRRGRRGFLPQTVGTGAGGLEGLTVIASTRTVLRRFLVVPDFCFVAAAMAGR
jgi:hypothetical protein